jgi:hypothetical protein
MLSTAYRIFSSFFLYNIIPYVDESILKFLECVWLYRSTTDSMLCIRQIVEKKT